MSQRIVAAYDGSDYSERALDWAIQEAAAQEIPLKIVVSTGRPVGVDQSLYGPFLDAVQEESEKLTRAAVAKAKDAGVQVQGIIERGDAAGVIVYEAKDSSLVVMGKRGRHGVRGRVGSVSAATASHSPVPVVILPESWNPAQRESRSEDESFEGAVVVGVDKLGAKNKAVHVAADYARAHGLTLAVVSVVPTTSYLPMNSSELERAVQEQLLAPAKELTDQVAEELRAKYSDLNIVTRVLQGRPADALVDASRTADLLVMGSRGYGGFRGLLMGSVSQSVLADTESPLMIVPNREK
ncbi:MULTISPECIES: universal stress protein [Kocuria]|jgi:nucleotide-binding universal stress UspA family protein|uniref:Universal stress protein n=2 Tax=Kocuria TaxID=57493 RepID=A0ABP8WQA1_9MICC|nr:universal stress protein [Kocuria sp.]MDO5368528.1 universal stress protein [Kocuria sp.]